jgi:multiple sugar transport system substrate-binding protein
MSRKALMVAASVVLVVSGCIGATRSSPESTSPAPSATAAQPATSAATESAAASATPTPDPVTITFWNPNTDRELGVFQDSLDRFEQLYPWITVNQVGGQDDPSKMLAAVNAGEPPDVWLSFTPEVVRSYCESGALLDLAPLAARDKLDLGQFSQEAIAAFSINGQTCALPQLVDAYGLYYNTDLLAAAGYSAPPKTMSELAAMTKKLTQLGSDGSIKVAGFVPLTGFYDLGWPTYRTAFGAHAYDASGASQLATDPRWVDALQWQRGLVDWYGYDKLARFTAGLGENYSSSNAAELGKLAMWADGEWRIAFIASEHPELHYATAPFPVADDQPDRYGAGVIVPQPIGIPKGAAHPNAAWLLVRYLAADPIAQGAIATGISNLPAISNPEGFTPDSRFAPFVDVYRSQANVMDLPPTSAPNSGDLVTTFFEKWQSGKVSDLNAGLRDLAASMDAEATR